MGWRRAFVSALAASVMGCWQLASPTPTPTPPAVDAGPPDARCDGGSAPRQWTQVWEHPLSSLPARAQTATGQWLGSGIVMVGGRSCYQQRADWNYAYIPVTRSSTNREAVQVDVYYPAADYRGFGLSAHGQRLGLNGSVNSIGVGFGPMTFGVGGHDTSTMGTDIFSGDFTFPADQWVTVRMEIDRDAMRLDVIVDGNVIAPCLPIASEDWLMGASVILSAGGSLPRNVPANICWSNLKVYEG